MSIKKVTQEILSIIRSIKTKNSSGYEISTKLLKISADYICSPLTYICNKSVLTGILPERLKYSTIKPLYKKGDKNRPIQLQTDVTTDLILKSYRKSLVQ
jgi:hypothetical protein